MSKHPTPRIDQLRAMREAQFASNAARQKAAERAQTPVMEEPAQGTEPAAAKSSSAKPAAAKSASAKSAKKAPAKKATKKTKKPGK